nr:unnamed protein product [Callosobruchus chinensis]
MDTYIRDFKIEKINAAILADLKNARHFLRRKSGFELNVLHINIRSINKNINELCVLLQILDYCFDIVVLSETFLVNDTNLIKIPNYNLFYNEGHVNKNDGVLVYVKECHIANYEIVDIVETKILTIVEYNDKKVQVIAVYRLYEFLGSNEAVDINLVVRDLNIDILNANNQHCHDYLNIMAEHNYLSAINGYTRMEGERGTCLDHIFINSSILSIDCIFSAILQYNIIDHFPVMLRISTKNNSENKQKTAQRYKTYINYKKLNETLSNENWYDIYKEVDPGRAFDLFVKLLGQNIENSSKTVKITRNKIKRQPWISEGIVNSINKKNQMYKDIKKYPENIQLLTDFKTYRNKLTSLIKQAKTNFIKNKVDEQRNCPRKMWQFINSYRKTQKRSDINFIESSITYEKTSNDKETANEFCKYFSEIGEKLAKNITNEFWKNKNT